MPQLDLDLFDNFLFFAFISLIFGFGDETIEENVIENSGDSFLFFFLQKIRILVLNDKSFLLKGFNIYFK